MRDLLERAGEPDARIPSPAELPHDFELAVLELLSQSQRVVAMALLGREHVRLLVAVKRFAVVDVLDLNGFKCLAVRSRNRGHLEAVAGAGDEGAGTKRR